MISIIIPVYNSSGTLPRCLESVLAQSYTDWEICLVDDGSVDGSGELCDLWSQQDSRIHTFHQPNSGPSAARNQGLACTHGELVSFIDADDVIHPQYLEVLHDLLLPDVDIACVSYQLVSETPRWPKQIEIAKPMLFSREEALTDLLYQGIIDPSSWGKLYRRTLAGRFPEQYHLYEDLYYTMHLIFNANRVAAVSSPLYGYYKSKEGLHAQAAVNLKVFTVFDELESWLSQQMPNLVPALHSRRLSVAFNNIRLMCSTSLFDRAAFNLSRLEIVRWRGEVWQDSRSRLKNKIGILLSYLFCY